MIKNAITYLLFLISFCSQSFCQNETPLSAPGITVFPLIKEGEDIDSALKDTIVRSAIARVNEIFDKKGYSTRSFAGNYKANQAYFDSLYKFKVRPTLYSSMDIGIEVSTKITVTPAGNQVAVTIKAIEGATDKIVVTKTALSKQFSNQNFGMMAAGSVESVADDFMNELQGYINDWQENGKTILFEVNFADESKINPDTKIDSTGFSFDKTVDAWLVKNAFKGNYESKEKTKNKLQYYVKIPLRDPETGHNFTIRSFAILFTKYCMSVGISCKKDTWGNKLFVTIK